MNRTKNKKESFILYTEQQELFKELSDEQAGELIKGIFKYVKTGELPSFSGISKMAFIPIRQMLDRNLIKYEEKREKLRQNGKKGGRPSINNDETYSYENEESIYQEQEIENENENENEIRQNISLEELQAISEMQDIYEQASDEDEEYEEESNSTNDYQNTNVEQNSYDNGPERFSEILRESHPDIYKQYLYFKKTNGKNTDSG